MSYFSMNLKKSFQSALEILQLNESAMTQVAMDGEATRPAALFVVLGALAAGLGVTFFPVHMGMVVYRPDLFWIVKMTFFESVGMLLGLYFGGFVAEKVFHSRLNRDGFVRVMGHASLLGVLAVFPPLSILCVWNLVVWWRVCTRIGKMQPEATVLFLIILVVFAAGLSSLG